MSWDPQQPYRRPSLFGGGFSLFPPGIKFLLIANGSVYLLQLFFGSFHIGTSGTLDRFITDFGALSPIGGWLDNSDYPIRIVHFMIWQPFTYMFLHAGFGHIFVNMLLLWMLGMEVEQTWGTKKFLTYYILCGLGGAAAHLILSDALGMAQGPLVGASGAIFGVMIAFWFMFPDRYVYIYFFFPIRAKYLIPILVAIEAYSSVHATDNIGHLAHLGGAITGMIYLLITSGGHLLRLRREKAADPIWRGSAPRNGDVGGGLFGGRSPFRGPARRGGAVDAEYHDIESGRQPSQTTGDVKQGRVITQDEIDRILDKIAATGYQNLTEEERDVLFEASRRMEERR